MLASPVSGLAADAVLHDRDFAYIAKLVYDRSGIVLQDSKRSLVVARLHKRLRALGLASYADYIRLLERDQQGDEFVQFLDALTTNHTSFFREAQHFDLLQSRVVPEWRAGHGAGTFKVWSAACSSGEEPYTLAISLLELNPVPAFSIVASDLSTKVLRKAQAAVYPLATVQSLPLPILRKYFEKGQGEQAGLARVGAAARRHVAFRHLNLLEIDDLGERYDTIFCRNVMIYFDKTIQQRVVRMLERHLAPGGYLFISHSETLNGITHGLSWVAPAVYRRKA